MVETAPTCSHCHAANSVAETPELFYCTVCGWWGTNPNKMIHDYESFHDEDWRQGQVPRRPIS